MVETLTTYISPEQIRPLRRQEYDRLVAQGVFKEEKLELLKGMIVTMSPQGPRHAAVVQRLTMLLAPAIQGRADLRVQCPLAVSDDSEPEPDLAVVDMGDYLHHHPRTARLVIEVAESSLDKDRHIKAGLYASCGVIEYWLVDLSEGVVEVYTEPSDGKYLERTTCRSEETIHPRAFPDIALLLKSFLP